MILVTGIHTAFSQDGLLERRFMCYTARGTAPFLLRKVSTYSNVVIEYAGTYLEGGSTMQLREGVTTLGNVLNGLLAGKRVRVTERNGKIVLIPSDIVLALPKPVDQYTLFGYTKEENSLEPLPYAVIIDLETGQAAQSNMFGYYSICLTRGLHHLRITHTGHPAKVLEVLVAGAARRDFTLNPAVLREVKVTPGYILPKDGGSNVDKYLSAAYNNFLGESDPVRSLYLMPGNVESEDAMGRLMVRGGDPEQSVFLLDGNQVFNPTHVLGEISIISESSLKSIRQFKNDFPARFDGALSSVTEVNTKDGNMYKWSGQLNTGLLAAAAVVEGPLQKGRTAMMASFRRSWSDPLLNILDSNYRLRFYDIHFKITHLFNSNDKLMFSGYIGNDRLQLRQTESQNLQVWGNRLATINWSHVVNSHVFMNTTVNVSNYHNLAGFKLLNVDTVTGVTKRSRAYNNYASIERYEAKTQFEINTSANTQFRFGGKLLHTVIRPFDTNMSSELQEEVDNNTPMRPLPFTEMSVYYENEIRPGRQLLIRPGMNVSFYRFRDYHYNSFQPRLFAAYGIGKYQHLTFSYTRMVQYLHQVTSPGLGINREIWVPSTDLLRPAEGDMFNLGYNFNNGKGVSLAADLYYRKMNNITNIADNVDFFYDEDNWEQDIATGKGWSYGTELLAGKRMKKWGVQLSYALAWSWRQFEEVNEGRKFPFRYDRRHNLSLAANYQPDKHWDFAMIWRFSTGDWIPPQVDILPGGDENRPQLSMKLPYYDHRSPSHFRLNYNMNYYFNTGRLKHKISGGLYNVIQSKDKYLNDIRNADNSDLTPTDNHLFNPTYYLSYTLNF